MGVRYLSAQSEAHHHQSRSSNRTFDPVPSGTRTLRDWKPTHQSPAGRSPEPPGRERRETASNQVLATGIAARRVDSESRKNMNEALERLRRPVCAECILIY